MLICIYIIYIHKGVVVMEISTLRGSNLIAFLEDSEYKTRRMFLREMARKFKEAGIIYGLACSSALFFKGIVDDFNDYDIIVDEADMERAGSILIEELKCLEQQVEYNPYCRSKKFREFRGGHVDIDMIAGFQIFTFGTHYLYEISKDDIDYMEIDGNRVPVVALEAQFLLYAMMEGWQLKRRFKRVLIGQYLNQYGLKHREILEIALKQNLPDWIEKEVRQLM